jgi:aspartate/methionine/tyrosine aminotransferase
MPNSRLPQGGQNLFQAIKQKCAEAENAGKTLYRLSTGQPIGPALLSARVAAAKAVMSDEETMHEYQDNGSPGVPDFAKRFIKAQVKNSLENKEVDYLPTPGSKPMLGLVPLACGCSNHKITVGTMTEPGYPTPADWCNYLNVNNYALPLNPENEFRFRVNDIKNGTDLLMLNYPHNPSGQIATQTYWEELCQYCADNNIRIFNDAAYAALAHSPEHSTLADVAVNFPELSWAEAFSASKAIGNGTGWRIGAMVGSTDFISDIKTIKGNTDSGFAAPMAAGVISAFENDQQGIRQNKEIYNKRLGQLIKILTSHGMQLAVKPNAGFFTLWKLPNKAFGKKIKNAQAFNFLMIEKTGIVGVHFDPYIRYAVCGDIDAMAEIIDEGFKQAAVEY